MAKILYFAMVRERLGRTSEELSLPPRVTTVATLLDHLRARGEREAAVLGAPFLRVAVNQVYARPTDPVSDGDEIAIFPPVSGG